MTDPILDALDPEQRQVATRLDAPLVVLAGAGTGKTRAITHRVAHAVREGRYAANATLAVTFTTRAAGEMKARLARLGVRGAQARTIHSAALRQCQYFWPATYGTDFPPVAENTFVFTARAAHRVLGASDANLVRDLEAEISWAKSSNVPAGRYAALAGRARREVNGASPSQVAAVFEAYERAKTDAGQVDFNDILLCAASLLAEQPAVADAIRGTYRHFVVDEYQDVSALQHRLIQLWVDGRRDVCVVGDPHQAIHAFAGARADYLLGFADEHEDAAVVRLVRNYRSTPQVLRLANQVLRLREGAGALVPTRPTGPAPSLHEEGTDADEAAALAGWLAEQRRAGTPWSELAVLYRINAQSPALEAALADAGIPYTVRGAERFYERAEVRQAVSELVRAAEADALTPAVTLAESVLGRLGWTPQPPTGMGRQRERWESLTALLAMVTEEEAERDRFGGVEFSAWLTERAALEAAPQADAVTLSTMHAAKGLEWDGVAVIGVKEGLVPFSLSQEEPALSEERRLLHVALTRARRHLRISWAVAGSGRGRGRRSRFLTGIGGEATVAPAAQKSAGGRSQRSKVCSVCGKQLVTSAERKLSRHEECEVAYDEGLLAALKAWRLETATAASVPAFVVFTDATLRAVAEAEPRTKSALLKLPGIGQTKVERHGAQCLAVIAAHVAARA